MNEIKEEKEVIDVKPDEIFDEDSIHIKINKTMHKYYIERNITIIVFFLTIIAYILLSTLVKFPEGIGYYGLNGWAFWWILFLEVPVIPQVYSAIKWKNIAAFPISSLCLIAFLLLGLFLGRWHPAWVIFFLIPIYHAFAKIMYLKRLNK